jgi:uncharacterized protein (TIGR03435 family)
MRCGRLTGTNSSIASLVYTLARELGTFIDDQTNLRGRYDFEFEYAPSHSCQQAPDGSDKIRAPVELERPFHLRGTP